MFYLVLLLLFFASIPLLFLYQTKKDQNNNSLKEEFLYYWQNSSIFQKIIERNNWHFDTHYKQVKEAVVAAKRSPEIQSELKRLKENKQRIEQAGQRVSLFVFSNIDTLLEVFENRDSISKTDLLRKLKEKYNKDSDCLELLRGWENHWCNKLAKSNADDYILNIFFVEHPYKTDNLGNKICLSLKEYKDLANKLDWRN